MVKMVQRAVAGFAFFLVFLAKVVLWQKPQRERLKLDSVDNDGYGLSWRFAVETNNVGPWRTVPLRCYEHVKAYMTGGQYERDLVLIRDQMLAYALDISLGGDGMDAWILDVDDTCISNKLYYSGKRFGCDSFNSTEFKAWITKGECPAIPAVLVLFNKLLVRGFKVFLVTGRNEATLTNITTHNLHNQGFIGYQRLILRSAEYRGQRAATYKSQIRKQIEGEGYRIWGNVGDQWSDLQGDCLGNRTFKLPNPMYCIP